MNRALSVCLPLLLSACTSAPALPALSAPVETAPLERFTYRAVVRSVPSGASAICLRVRVPEVSPGELRPVQAYGLIGNAPFELDFPATPTSADEPRVVSASGREPARLGWTTVDEGGIRYRELVVESRGKPLELALELASLRAAALETSALEETLARGTSATADGQPLELWTRLERVR